MKVDYQKTFIYKLCCRDPTITDIYVGHSTNFKQRNQGPSYHVFLLCVYQHSNMLCPILSLHIQTVGLF